MIAFIVQFLATVLGAVLLVLAVVAVLRSLVTPKPTALGKSEAEWEKLVRNLNG